MFDLSLGNGKNPKKVRTFGDNEQVFRLIDRPVYVDANKFQFRFFFPIARLLFLARTRLHE